MTEASSFLHTFFETQGFSLGQAQHIVCTPDAQHVLFVRARIPEPTLDLYEFDVASKRVRCVLRPEDLLGSATESLTPEEQSLRERLRMNAQGIARFRMSPDGTQLLIPFSGKLFLYQRVQKTWRSLETGPAFDPCWCPTGTAFAYVQERNVWLYSLHTHSKHCLTNSQHADISYGLAEFVAQEEMDRFSGFWFSPTGTHVAICEVDNRAVEHWSVPDVAHPERPPVQMAYPPAGGTNALVRLGIFPRQGGIPCWVDWDREVFPYLATVRWHRGPLTLVVQDRSQKHLRVLRVDESTGHTDCLLEEQDDAWINLDQTMPCWLGPERGFLWSTERNGGPELELRAPNGVLQRTLVPFSLGYRKLLQVDVDQESCWLLASAEPTECHVYQVSIETPAIVLQTVLPGMHTGVGLPARGLWVHTHVSLQHMLTTRVYATQIGENPFSAKHPDVLDSFFTSPPWVPQGMLMKVTADEMRVCVIKPRISTFGQRYPVLVDVYGGPGHIHVVHNMRLLFLKQWLADQGFVVVSIDGRGTPGRGRAWERAIVGNFVEVALEEQVKGLHALLEQDPTLDGSRVGIFGWSFGGTLASLAVLQRPDVFQAGFAGAPVTDWRLYDTHYTERYLGLPTQNPDGYARNSPLTHASKLSRPLSIAHGTADDNVFFTHTLQLSHALWLASKPHELIPLVGATHRVTNTQQNCREWEFMRDFFQRHLGHPTP